jgi:tetratricopeptide (TPR) repeat protein
LETPFPAYSGDDDFVFICYSHQDSETVYQELELLHASAVNIWYDEGISPGAEWTDELANAIRNCKAMLLFVTPRTVQSKHCRDEVQYATKFNKPIIVIYLEPTLLPPGLDLTLGSLHAVEKGHHNEARFLELIVEAIKQHIAGDTPRAKQGPTQPTIPEPGLAPNPAKPKSKLTNKMVAIGGGLAVVALATLLVLWPATEKKAPTNPLAELNTSNSVALLPFEVRGGFETDTYYPESVAEDLLNRLVAIDGLRVASRRSSFAQNLQTQLSGDLFQIAEDLRVSALVVGYIRRSGDLIDLSLELIDLSSGSEVVRWSNKYEARPLNHMLTIQTDVTRQIALALLPAGLSPANEERLAKISTNSPEAYEYYLRAREYLRRPASGSTYVQEAARLFEAAIELDGGFAWARAGLCSANRLNYEIQKGLFETAKEACETLDGYQEDLFDVRIALGDFYRVTGKLDKALAELEIANKLNNNSADAKLSLAKVLADRFALNNHEPDRDRAEKIYLESISTEPSYWFTNHAYAGFLADQNRLEEAKAQLEVALSKDSSSLASLNNLAGVLYRQGFTDQAEQRWQEAIELSDDNGWAYSGLGILYHYKSDFDKAVVFLSRATEIAPDDHSHWGRLGESYRMIPGHEQEAHAAFTHAISLANESLRINSNDWQVYGYMAIYQAYIGDFDAAEIALDNMFKLNPAANPTTHYWAALVAYEAADIDRAFDELDKALLNGYSQQKIFITDEPALAKLRSKYAERFAKLLARY